MERKKKEAEKKKAQKKAKQEQQKVQREEEEKQKAEEREKQRFLNLSDREKVGVAMNIYTIVLKAHNVYLYI